MYKLLVCDDEKWIRQGLQAQIQDMGLPFSDIYEAHDEKSAIKVIETEKPEIVVTDIRMKKSNGLELIEKTAGRDIQFVIISGYGEFAYAEKAIKLGVCAYLLKPVDKDELKKALELAIERTENNRIMRKSKNAEEVLEQDNRQVKLENIINRIFFSPDEEQQQLLFEQVKEVWMLPESRYRCCVLRIESSSFETSGFRYRDMELLKYGIKNIIDELVRQGKMNVRSFNDVSDLQKIIMIAVDPERERLESQTNSLALQLIHDITTELGITVTISISRVHDTIGRMLYAETKIAENYKFVKGVNRIYYYNENLTKSSGYSIPEHQLELLRNCIERRNVEGITKVVHNLILASEQEESIGDYIFCVYIGIINMVMNINPEALHFLNYQKKVFMNADELGRFEDSREIERYILDILITVCEYKGAEETTATIDCKAIIMQVKAYIDRNFINDISVGNIAKRFNINPTYFSTIFKQQMGISFTEYLRNVRIEKACELLENSDMSTELIASSIGFNDVFYFYRVFKKVRGKTPTEYRKDFQKKS